MAIPTSASNSAQRSSASTAGTRAATLAAETDRVVGLAGDGAAILAVALGYFAGTRIGFALTPGDEPIAVFWPPNAILLAAFLLAPVRLWLSFLLILIPTHFLAQLQSGVPVVTSLGWLVGNCGEALLGATLISKLGRRNATFDTIHGATRFLLYGFILAPVATSFLDAAIVVGTRWGQGYWFLWSMRLLSNMLAQLTIVPTIVGFGTTGVSWIKESTRPMRLEAAILAATVLAVSLFVFRAEALSRASIPALIYLPLPVLLWAAIRFGTTGVSASLLTIAVVSIQSVLHGRGPFVAASVATSVLSMQVCLCMIGVPLILLAAVRSEQRKTEHSLRVTSYKLIGAQERERQRIAQELHDDVGQTLALVEIELDRMIANRQNQTESSLNKLREQMTRISRAVWEISHGLYPSNLEFLGVEHALARLCSDLQEETRLRVRFEAAIPHRLPADVSLCLFRVVQEALQNIVRHSHASEVSVRVRVRGARLLLEIVDDGVGFNPSYVTLGLGFASMRERLKAVTGGLEVESAAGRGTRVDAWVTLRRDPG